MGPVQSTEKLSNLDWRCLNFFHTELAIKIFIALYSLSQRFGMVQCSRKRVDFEKERKERKQRTYSFHRPLNHSAFNIRLPKVSIPVSH